MAQRFIPFLWLLIVLTVVVSGCSYEPVVGPRRFNLAAEPTLVPTSEAIARPIYTIQQGLVTEHFRFDGRVSPRLETAVFAPQTGTILDIEVQVGDYVIAGDRLARYDFAALESELAAVQEAQQALQTTIDQQFAAQAEARERALLELEIARTELELAEQNSPEQRSETEEKRLELLALQVSLAESNLIRADAAIDPDKAVTDRIAELAQQAAELEAKMGTKGVHTPIDGVVLGLGISAGNRVNEEQTVAIIGELGTAEDLSIAAVLRSDDLERLAEGMHATLTFLSLPDERFTGQVRRLPYPYNVGGNDLAFDDEDNAVRILPDDPNMLNRFKPGELVSVEIMLDENPEALWLPDEAIREFSGRTFIVVRDGTREQRIDIERGLQGDGRVEIIGRVEVGQEVVGP